MHIPICVPLLKYRTWEDSTDPEKSAFFKKIMDAGAALENKGTRGIIIQEHTESFRNAVSKHYGTTLISEALATEIVSDILDLYGVKLGRIFKP